MAARRVAVPLFTRTGKMTDDDHPPDHDSFLQTILRSFFGRQSKSPHVRDPNQPAVVEGLRRAVRASDADLPELEASHGISGAELSDDEEDEAQYRLASEWRRDEGR
jgi:hypothetical protein